jgi:hypothetical protein
LPHRATALSRNTRNHRASRVRPCTSRVRPCADDARARAGSGLATPRVTSRVRPCADRGRATSTSRVRPCDEQCQALRAGPSRVRPCADEETSRVRRGTNRGRAGSGLATPCDGALAQHPKPWRPPCRARDAVPSPAPLQLRQLSALSYAKVTRCLMHGSHTLGRIKVAGSRRLPP